MFVMQEKWIRGYFVVVSCLPVLTIALNRGFLSKLLSLYPFRLFSKIQLEFFILHQSIIITLGNVLATRVSQSPYIRTIILFGLILVSSILFRVLCKKILSLRTQAC